MRDVATTSSLFPTICQYDSVRPLERTTCLRVGVMFSVCATELVDEYVLQISAGCYDDVTVGRGILSTFLSSNNSFSEVPGAYWTIRPEHRTTQTGTGIAFTLQTNRLFDKRAGSPLLTYGKSPKITAKVKRSHSYRRNCGCCSIWDPMPGRANV